jgi:multicomponent Na+:H+ antiporter subunit G
VIGELITLLGAVLVLLAAIGVVRFPDALSRMQSLTKASTIGVALVAIGSLFVLPTWNDDTSAIAAALLQLLTLPISASLIARATYRARAIDNRVDTVDELADRRWHERSPADPTLDADGRSSRPAR